MNIVSIFAHQDDEMRCLGTMMKCKDRGDSLAFIVLTDGARGIDNPKLSQKEKGAIRHAEMGELAAKLDAPYITLDEPDEFLYDTPEVRMRLIEAIRKTKADVIFTHYEVDYNLDHITVSNLVRQCAMQSCMAFLPTESAPLAQHPAVFLAAPHGPVEFPATYFVDVTKYQDRKGELMECHKSQNEAMRAAVAVQEDLDTLCRRFDSYWGQQVGCAYAECFVPMRARGAIKPYPVLP